MNRHSIKYRADIDGLRALAVLAVLFFHAYPRSIKGGFIGVDVFFVISGFLISTIIFENLDRDRFSIKDFYIRRVRRIFPALGVVMAVCFAIGWFALLADEFAQLGKHIAAGAGFISNLVLWGESGYFDNSGETKPLLHLWSLGIEEQFYLFWPLLIAAAHFRKWRMLPIIIGLAIFSFVLNIIMIYGNPVATFYSPITRLWELLIGSLLAHIMLKKRPQIEKHFAQYADLISLSGLLLIIAGLFLLNKSRGFPGWWALFPTVGAAFLIFAGPRAIINRTLLSWRPMVGIGLISYPLYLWHWPLLSFARIIEGQVPGLVVRNCLVLLSFVLAYLTYRFVEKPFRLGVDEKRKVVILLTIVFGMAAIGYVTYLNEGWVARAAVQNSNATNEVRQQFVGAKWPYSENDVCKTRYPFEESKDYPWWFCMLSRDASPTVIVMGDSFANQLYPGLTEDNRLNHHAVLSIGTCSPARIDEATVTDEVNRSPCTSRRILNQERFIDNIIRNSPTLKFAILAGLVKQPDATYVRQLKQRIEFLESQNIRVVLFTPYINFNYDIRSCFSRPFKKQVHCDIGVEARSELNASFAPLVQEIKRTHPRVLFFDQNELFCNEQGCTPLHDGMPLLRDEFKHISKYGSLRLANIFQAWAEKNLPEYFN